MSGVLESEEVIKQRVEFCERVSLLEVIANFEALYSQRSRILLYSLDRGRKCSLIRSFSDLLQFLGGSLQRNRETKLVCVLAIRLATRNDR